MEPVRFSERTPEQIRQGSVRERVISPTAAIIALVLFFGAFSGAALWKLASKEGKLTRLKEIQFVPETPDLEKFDLKDPQRELMRNVEDRPELKETEADVQVIETRDVEIKDDALKAQTLDSVTAVDLRSDKLDLVDDLDRADNTPDEPVGLSPLAVLVGEPADFFANAEPQPRARKKSGLIGGLPRTPPAMKISPQMFGDPNAPEFDELSAVDIGIFGDGDYNAAIRHGGLATRSAVEAALRWLALHQESDGSWSPGRWNDETSPMDDALRPLGNEPGKAPPDQCAITAFAVMALMGGGSNLRRGEHRAAVMRGIEWLLCEQNAQTGYFSKNMYAHAISTIAVCEAIGRSPDERVAKGARKAVDACVAGMARNGGWRYVSKAADSDVSVTSWFLQALKTAKLANIKFDHSAFSQGLTFIDRCTDKLAMDGSSGAVGYSERPIEDMPAVTGPAQNNYPALTCAAMVIRQFNGMGVKHPLLVAGADLTRKLPPDWEKKNFYYWYYATFAMHNMGGENRLWWNRRIRDVLLDHQSRRGHQTGSWNPKDDSWGKCRVYTTALGALCLEVYDRYGEALQSFGTVPSVEELFFRK